VVSIPKGIQPQKTPNNTEGETIYPSKMAKAEKLDDIKLMALACICADRTRFSVLFLFAHRHLIRRVGAVVRSGGFGLGRGLLPL